jgi:hypothetical protein
MKIWRETIKKRSIKEGNKINSNNISRSKGSKK